MKNRFAKLLFAVLSITGVLLLELGTPVPSIGETFYNGIITENVNFRKTPSLQGKVFAGLLQGSAVKIYEEKDGWYRVSAKKAHQVFNGWVSIEYVKIVVVETTATPPGTGEPELSGLEQSLPPVEERDPSAPSAVPEKPLPTPVEKAPPPEVKVPVVSPGLDKPAAAEPPKAKIADTKTAQPPRTEKTPEPEPAKRAAATPPKAKIADTKTEQPPRVDKTPVPDAGTEPADDWIRLLPTALPVLAVIVLLIALFVYLVRRASGPKAEIPDSPAESAPVVWPPPPAKNSPVAEDNPVAEDSPVVEDSLELEETEPIDEALSADFDFQMESIPGDRTSGDDANGSTEVVSVSDDAESSTKDISVSDDAESSTKDISVSDDSESSTKDVSVSDDAESSTKDVFVSDDSESSTEDVFVSDDSESSTEDVPVYDLVIQKINRMSDVELVELLDLVDEQQGENSRKDDRLIFYTTVDYVVEGQYYRDFVQDLSVSGVFIKTRQMFEPGQHILMTFMSPFLQKPFKISGEIVRTLNTGIGVNFDKESQVQTEAISALMDQVHMIEKSG